MFRPQWKEYYIHALLQNKEIKKTLPLIQELIAVYQGEKRIRWQEILLHQYLQLGMDEKALSYAKVLSSNSPHVEKWWKMLTHLYLDKHRYEDGLSSFLIYSYLKRFKEKKLTEEETTLLADLFLQVNIPIKSALYYQELATKNPDKDIVYKLAVSQLESGCIEKALRAIEEYPASVEDYQLLMLHGELNYRLNRFPQAEHSFRIAAKNSKNDSGRAWLMAGYTAMQGDDLDSSRDAFTHALAYNDIKDKAESALQQLQRITEERAN